MYNRRVYNRACVYRLKRLTVAVVPGLESAVGVIDRFRTAFVPCVGSGVYSSLVDGEGRRVAEGLGWGSFIGGRKPANVAITGTL